MDRLPDELLLCIGGLTRTGWDGQAHLHALMLGCRRFHGLFRPLLYAHLSMQNFSHRSIGLVMRMWREPSLAAQVRRLDLCWTRCEEFDEDEDDREEDDKVAAARFAQDALDELFGPKREVEEEEDDDDEQEGVEQEEQREREQGGEEEEEEEEEEENEEEGEEEEEDDEDDEDQEETDDEEKRELWDEHLGKDTDCGEAWSALLLMRLPRLQHIEFAHESSELMPDLLTKAALRQRPFDQGPHPFPHLRKVSAHSAWGDASITTSFLTPFFAFPAVASITGSLITQSRREPDAARRLLRPGSASSIRVIDLETVYDCRGLLGWLAACTALSRVCLTNELHWEDDAPETPERQFDMARVRAALLPSAATLRTLRVRYGQRYTEDVVDEREAPERPFGSFCEFVALEDLSVRHDHLLCLDDAAAGARRPLLSETLPRSLVRLEITDVVAGFYGELLSGLEQLLRERHKVPKLRKLVIDTCGDDEEQAGGGAFGALMLECQAAGIVMKMGVDEDDFSRW